MSQQSRDPLPAPEPSDCSPDAGTEPRGHTSDMTEYLFEYLFSQLPPHPSVEPVAPLRFVPVASRAWSFVNRFYPPSRLEPPDASPYCCDRCKPGAMPAEALRGVEPSHEPPANSGSTEERADRVTPGTTPYYCDRCRPRATPAEARRFEIGRA